MLKSLQTLVKKCKKSKNLNIMNISIVLTTIFSAIFVAIAENQEEFLRSIFLYPGAIFIYLNILIRNPRIFILYITTIIITKKYSYKLINNI